MSSLVRIINNIGGKVFGKQYYKMAIYLKLSLAAKQPPVLIWQMGKVGSSTIERTLKNSGYQGAVFHVHILSDKLLQKGELLQRSKKQGNLSYLYNQALREVLLKNDRNWKIVSLVREPVGRNISSFFQNLDVYIPEYRIDDALDERINAKTLIEIFFNKFDHDRPMEWFEYEFNGLLDLDVYALPFDKTRGYQIYANDNYDALIIRMENLSNVGEEALRKYLAVNDIKLKKANIADNKSYSTTYKDVRENIEMPDEYLNKMFESRYANHFYTGKEIERLKIKWHC